MHLLKVNTKGTTLVLSVLVAMLKGETLMNYTIQSIWKIKPGCSGGSTVPGSETWLFSVVSHL